MIVPWSPGTFSAWGMLQTDMRHDVVRSFYQPLAACDRRRGGCVLGRLEAEGARAARGRRESTPTAQVLRPLGRHALRRPGVQGRRADRARWISAGEIGGAFHDAHRVRYGHSTPGAPVEFVNLRVAAMGRIAGAAPPFGRRSRTPTRCSARGTVDVRRRAEHETQRAAPRSSARRVGEGPVVMEEAEIDHASCRPGTSSPSTSKATY